MVKTEPPKNNPSKPPHSDKKSGSVISVFQYASKFPPGDLRKRWTIAMIAYSNIKSNRKSAPSINGIIKKKKSIKMETGNDRNNFWMNFNQIMFNSYPSFEMPRFCSKISKSNLVLDWSARWHTVARVKMRLSCIFIREIFNIFSEKFNFSMLIAFYFWSTTNFRIDISWSKRIKTFIDIL